MDAIPFGLLEVEDEVVPMSVPDADGTGGGNDGGPSPL
jgi:hypothetical protein